MSDQLEAFGDVDLEAKSPDKAMRWYCRKCGSEAVLGVSRLDASERMAIAVRCDGCGRKHVIVERILPPKPSSDSP
jgi:RNase P subunit RPR2